MLAAIVFAGCPQTGIAAEEVLTNGGFEKLDTTSVPAGWVLYTGNVPESQETIDPRAHSGIHAVRLLATGPEGRDNRYSIGLQQDAACVPGKHYVGSIWIKALARNHTDAVILQMSFPGTDLVKSRSLAPPINGDWQKFTVNAVGPSGCSKIRLLIYALHYWTSETLLDDASLQVDALDTTGARGAVLKYGDVPLKTPHELQMATPLVMGGQPFATIAAPADPAWQKLANELQSELQKKTGVKLPICPPDKLASLLASEKNIIAIGNMNNNFVMERLYFNFYTRADSLWPGPGAFALRTIHQPLNFSDKINVLAIEAGDLTGAQAGVAELLNRLPSGRDCGLNKPLLYVSNAQRLDEVKLKELPSLDGDRDLWCRFQEAARGYRDSGDLVWAKRAKEALQAATLRLNRDPNYRLTWPEETTSDGIGSLWDVIEEAPIWSDSERLEAENALFASMLSLPRHVGGYWGQFANNDTILFNHTTFPMLGIYWIARFMDRHHPQYSTAFADYLVQVQGAFRGQIKSWKPQCDSDSYGTLVPGHTMEYTLAQNDYSYFSSGQVRHYAEFMTGTHDNRGAPAGFGDSNYSPRPGYERLALPMALWYYKDGRYLWRLQQIYGKNWPNPYDQEVKPVPWTEMAGMTVWKQAPEFYRWVTTHPSADEPLVPTTVPYEKAFDKITFRENLDRNGQFLLLDGIARGKHLHYDGNAIIKYYADNEDWLVDGDYLVRNTTEHSMVSIVRDGRSDQLIPALAALQIQADLPMLSYTKTTVTGYNGADWSRNLLWLKGTGFVVLDEMTARKGGEYQFEGIYKTLQQGVQALSSDRIFTTERFSGDANSAKKRFFVKNDGNALVSLSDRINNVNLKLRYMHERTGGHLKEGEMRSFQTLFYNDRSDKPVPMDLMRVSSTSLLLLRDELPWAYYAVGQLDLAESYLLTKEQATLINPRQGSGIAADRPCALEIHFNEGDAVINALQPVNLSIGNERRALGAGQHRIDLRGWAGLTELHKRSQALLDSAAKTERITAKKEQAFAPSGSSPSDVMWRIPPVAGREGTASVNRVLPVDLDNDGVDELLVARGSGCFCFDSAGKELWSVTSGSQVNDIAAGDINRDGAKEIILASDDGSFIVFDRNGKMLSRTVVDAKTLVGGSSVIEPRVANVSLVDLDADGELDLVIGTRNGNICRYDSHLRRLWCDDSIDAGTYRMQFRDLNHDGKQEILVSSRYGSVKVFTADGRQIYSLYSELGDVVFDVADLDGDKKDEIINGSSTGVLLCSQYLGDKVFRFDNFGYAVTEIRDRDLNEDGHREVIIASETGYVYVVDGTGRMLASNHVGDAVLSLITTGEGHDTRIIAGTRDGRVTVLDGKLRVLRSLEMNGPVTRLVMMHGKGGQQLLLAAAGEALISIRL